MYFFFHLLVGVATALFISECFRSKRWFFPVAFGSILPDLIDKPLGHIILAESLGYGRLIGHSLLGICIALAVGYLVYRFWGSVAGYGIAAGMFVHQILDSMWINREVWFYPLYGPFPQGQYTDYFITSFWRELTSPQEWLSISLLVLFTIIFYAKPLSEHFGWNVHPPDLQYLFLTGAGVISLGFGIFLLLHLRDISSNVLYPIVRGGDPLVGTGALIWCGLAFLYIGWKRSFGSDPFEEV